jgi:AcrR family transcriptional regulator
MLLLQLSDVKCYPKCVILNRMKKTQPIRLKREQTQELTRQRLLDAAWSELARAGISGASVRGIAEAAGYSLGAVYSNFGRKEDIYLELMRRHMKAEVQSLQELLTQARSSPDATLTTIESWCCNMNSDLDWTMVALELHMHALRNPEFGDECSALFKAHRKAIGKAVQQLFEILGRHPVIDTEELASLFMGLAHGMALSRGEARGSADPAGRTIFVLLKAVVEASDLISKNTRSKLEVGGRKVRK